MRACGISLAQALICSTLTPSRGENQKAHLRNGKKLLSSDPLGQEILVVGVEVFGADHHEQIGVFAVFVDYSLHGVDHVRGAALTNIAALTLRRKSYWRVAATTIS